MPVDGDVENFSVGVELLLSPVTMVDVLLIITLYKVILRSVQSYPVEDDDSLVEKSPVLFGRQSHVVEEAEAERLAVFSVMTRRPDQTQTIAEGAGADCNRGFVSN